MRARLLLALSLALASVAPTALAQTPPAATAPAPVVARPLDPIAPSDRARLAWLASSLTDHGLPPLTAPPPAADDDAWLRLARRLVQTFAPPAQRSTSAVDQVLARRPLAPAIEALVPTHARYRDLQAQLRTLRRIVREGQPRLPPTPYKVRVGSTAPEVATLRARLALEGYGANHVTGRRAQYFDDRLKQDLWSWQRANGLPVTVVLDDLTRQRLNAPLDQALARVALALGRWRQISLRSELGRHVVVHLNRYRLWAERDGLPELEMPVVVGKATDADATPTLSSQLTRVVLNPSWTVPRRLVDAKLRPSVADEPDVLRAKGYKVDVKPDGRWRVSQPAGPDNPLGRIKFPLARTGGVYLHDTPAKADLGKRDRALSSGCVRVGDAAALARWLLPPEARPQFDLQLADTTTRSLPLDAPVDVHLIYQTLTVQDGRLTAHPDVYGLDAAALAAIDPSKLLAEPPDAPAAQVAPAAYQLGVTVTPLEGAPFSLERYRGRMLVVTFTAAWCSVCRQLAPELAGLVQALRDRGEDVALLGLALDEGGLDAARAAHAAHPPPFPLALPPPEVAQGASALGLVDKLPTTWIIGRTGVPLYRYEGGGVTPQMARDLARYLGVEKRFEAP